MQFKNALFPKVSKFFDNLSSFKFVHPAKLRSPIDVIVSGTITSSKPVFPNNAPGIAVASSSNDTFFNPEHPLNG